MKIALNIKVEDTLKKDFEAICDKLGINLSGAVIMFMNQVVLQERIPFELTTKKTESIHASDALVEKQREKDMRVMEMLLKYTELMSEKKE